MTPREPLTRRAAYDRALALGMNEPQLEHLRRRGMGVKNTVAVVTDPADRIRTDWADAAEAVAAFLRMQVRGFRDYGDALDSLSDSAREASAGD